MTSTDSSRSSSSHHNLDHPARRSAPHLENERTATMRKLRVGLAAGLVTASLTPVLPGLAAEASAGRRPILEGVAALNKPVTYSETKIPLGELVQRLAADTGAPLKAARDVADEPVAV